MIDSNWIKLHRRLLSSEVFQDEGLLKVFVWALLKASWRTQPAIRRVTTLQELRPGQFRYGRDRAAEELNMSPSTVRNRMEKLVELRCLDIKPDSHSSVVTVCNWDVYQSSPLDEGQVNGQPEDSQRTLEKKAKTNTSSRPALRFNGEDRELAEHIWKLVHELLPTRKPPDLDRWANTIRLMREQDGRTHEAIRVLFERAHRDPFWKTNIVSPEKLRTKFDDLELKLKSTPKHATRNTNPRTESPAVVRRESFANLPQVSTTNPTTDP